MDVLPLYEAEAKKRQGTRTDLKNIPQKIAGSEKGEATALKRQVVEYFFLFLLAKCNFVVVNEERRSFVSHAKVKFVIGLVLILLAVVPEDHNFTLASKGA